MTPDNLKSKFGNVQMNPLSPKQILRNLENGFFMTHQEQTEAANLIRQLQESNEALKSGMIDFAETIFKLRKESKLKMTPEHLPQYIATNNIKPTTEGGGGAGGNIAPISPDQYERFCGTCGACTGKPWVGLTLNDITGCMCDCADDDGTYKTSCFIDYAKAIEQKLKDLNT
jgi:hypothetical protein